MAESKKAQQFIPVENPTKHLKENNEKLAKYGGFDLLEACIEGVQNLNPERKARKKIFLTENAKKESRETLKKTLEIWADALSKSDNLSEMVEDSEKRSQISQKLFRHTV